MNTVVANKLQDTLGDRDVSARAETDSRPEKMKALRWHGNMSVSVDEVPVPAITEPKDAIVKVTGSTVCGSDLHLYHKEIMQLQDGDILGHEWMGVVDKVGPEVKNLKKGDRVVASFQIACGECSFCKRKLSSMCKMTNTSSVQEKLYGRPFAGMFGYSHFTGGFAGGQAEYVRAPFADVNLLKIPDSVPDEKALFLSDIIPTSYNAVLCAEVDKGKSVAIWGLGPIGLYCVQWAKLKGASRIVAIDNVPARLEMAKKLGAQPLDFSKVDNVEQELYKLEEDGFDCCIDAAAFRYTKTLLHTVQRAVGLETDSSEILNEMLRATKKFGNISLVADYAAYTNQFLVGALMEKGITLRGTGQCPVHKFWEENLKSIESGEFDPTTILSHRFKIDEFTELYDAFDKKEHGILKTFVETRFSAPPAKGTPALSSFKDNNIIPGPVG